MDFDLMHNALMLEKIRNFSFILEVQTKMKSFKCTKQLVLHSGIYVLLFFHILIANCMSHPWVCNVREHVWGFWEPEPNWQSDKAIVNPFVTIPEGEE